MNALISLALAASACTPGVEWRNAGDVALLANCPPGYFTTHEAVRSAIRQAGRREDLVIRFGRIASYPWLSSFLARQASSSRHWPEERAAPEGYVTRALLGMPEFTSLFDPPWRLAGLVVQDVRVRPARSLDLPQGHPLPADFLLPYDADLVVTLAR